MVMAAVLGGAFAGGLADRMKENREYTKTKSDEMQAFLYQTGLKRRNEVAKARQDLTDSVDYLESKGMDSERITAMLDQNPKEVIRLAGFAIKAEAKMTINGAILDSAVKIATGYNSPDLTPADLIKNATPDFIQGADLKKPDEVERSMLNQLFRSPDLQEIMYDNYSSDILGVKGKDIQASMSAPTVKGREGESVDTDMSVFGILGPTEVLQGQRIILNEYDNLLIQRLDELRTLQTDVDPSEVPALTERVKALKEIQDMKSPTQRKQKLELMLTNPDLGFDIARQYYSGVNGNSYFVNQPTFVDSSLIPYISGEEDYESPENNQRPAPTTPESDNEVQIPEISKPDNQSAIAAARKWFGKEENRGQPLVQIKMPDGSLQTYSREGGTKRVTLDSEET